VTTIPTASAKLTLVFKPGQLPAIDPDRPEFTIQIGNTRIAGKVNAKAARKLAVHQGGAVLQGRLVEEHGQLTLLECGFQFLDPPKPVEEATP
jgi:hypothetical protein